MNHGSGGLRITLVRHLVALISLTVALTGLGYNTWRNETTESHRNVRQAAFVMLADLGEFQQLVDRRFFGAERDELTRIRAWGRVAALRDVGPLVSAPVASAAGALEQAWQAQLPALDAGDPAAERTVSSAVRATRAAVMAELMALR
jgi:hypothetical protein